MDDDELAALALKAGFSVEDNGSITDGIETAQHLNDELRVFAGLVAERCAKICEQIDAEYLYSPNRGFALEVAAERIRAA